MKLHTQDKHTKKHTHTITDKSPASILSGQLFFGKFVTRRSADSIKQNCFSRACPDISVSLVLNNLIFWT